MKKINLVLAFLAIFSFGAVNLNGQTADQVQRGTVCIKSPIADDPNQYFSTQVIYNFEVYKAGKTETEMVLAAFRKDPAVESMASGILTGDYQAFNLVLKSQKNKEWFKSTFQKAGIKYVRINGHEPVPVEKM